MRPRGQRLLLEDAVLELRAAHQPLLELAQRREARREILPLAQLQRERERGVQDPATTWDSKIDNFDKRRQLLHAQTEDDPGTVITAEEVESVSFLMQVLWVIGRFKSMIRTV